MIGQQATWKNCSSPVFCLFGQRSLLDAAAVYVLHVCVSGQTSKLRTDVAECGGSCGGSRGPSEVLHRAARVQCNQEHDTRVRLRPLYSSLCLHQRGVPPQAEYLPDKGGKHPEVRGLSHSEVSRLCHVEPP